MGRHTSPTGSGSRRLRRAGLVLAVAAATVPVLAGVSGATGGSPYAAVGSVAILRNVHLNAGRTVSPGVLGGSTTVPSDANSVRLSVTVSGGGAGGSLYVDPAGRAHLTKALTWSKGQKRTATVEVAPGVRNEVTFYDSSAKPVTVSAAITGYENEGVNGPPGPPGHTGAPGASAIQYFVHLAADGTIVAASPTVDRDSTFKFINTGSTGQYAVGFTAPTDPRKCVATVTVVDASGSSTLTTYGYGSISYASSTQLAVSIYSPSGQLMNAAFDLLMEC